METHSGDRLRNRKGKAWNQAEKRTGLLSCIVVFQCTGFSFMPESCQIYLRLDNL